jgi:hypothetical protein
MTQHEQVKELLENHRGRNNPITSDEIKAHIGINDINGNLHTRKLITETIEMYNLPVGSTTTPQKGYYWMETNEELNDCVADLDGRIAGMEQRKQMIIKNYKESKQ